MPILSAEPALFPENLFDDVKGLGSDDRVWQVAATRPRQEKSLARRLHEAQIPFYLPVVARRLRSRGRTLTSYVPLFSGYVFLLADLQERQATLATNRVVRLLKVANQEEFWGDLRQINRLLTSGAPITPEERLAPGTMVEIQSGPLAGLQGTIIRAASGRRFVVKVDFIQQGASVLLDDFTLANCEIASLS